MTRFLEKYFFTILDKTLSIKTFDFFFLISIEVFNIKLIIRRVGEISTRPFLVLETAKSCKFHEHIHGNWNLYLFIFDNL
jgi:hypothetical protein